MQYATFSPFLTKTGDERSAPPPVGRVVIVEAVRVLTGTEGLDEVLRSHECQLLFNPTKLGLDQVPTFFDNICQVGHFPYIFAFQISVVANSGPDFCTNSRKDCRMTS